MTLYAPGTGPTTRPPRTPDHRLTPEARGVPDDPVELPQDHLACAVCGVAVHTSTISEVVHRDRASQAQQVTVGSVPVELGLCGDCRTRRDRASALVAEHTALAARMGNVAADRFESMLVSLHLLGREPVPNDVRDLVLHLRHLAHARLFWSGRATVGHATPYPFAHVRRGERLALRKTYAGIVHERAARSSGPIAVPPPEDARPGCLFCGVGAVTMGADRVMRLGGRDPAAREVWQRPIITTTRALGGKTSPGMVKGYLCPTCSDAATESVGQTSLGRALRAHLDPEQAESLRYHELRVIGWGGLGPVRANRTPWEHVDLSSLSNGNKAQLGTSSA